MATRPEDRNASQRFEAFPDGVTLAELEAYAAHVRSLGAPDDAHPRAKLNEDGEIIGIVCTTKRQGAPDTVSAALARDFERLNAATEPVLRSFVTGFADFCARATGRR